MIDPSDIPMIIGGIITLMLVAAVLMLTRMAGQDRSRKNSRKGGQS